jgi:hypothetical protein
VRSAEDLQAENGAAGQALDRERDGLIAHREYPVISLDSKAAGPERRRPAVTRKNAGRLTRTYGWVKCREWRPLTSEPVRVECESASLRSGHSRF